jgi:ABC-type dipeptide/oligopeptide/nickel transport system permease component
LIDFILKRIASSLIVILGSLTFVFFIINVLPGDVASMIAGENVPTEVVDELRIELGLDRPVWEQYLSYLGEVLSGNLGVSFATSEPVLSRLLEQLPATLSLTLASTTIAIILGVLLGVLAAVYRDSWVDNIIRVISLIGVSTPTFWIGILLILIFSVYLNLLPAIGNGSFQQLILPSIGLGMIGAGTLARLVRNSMLDVINESFVRTLRSKGVSENRIMYKHVLRNALIPTITLVGVIFGEMLAGSVVTETVFSRQGLGRVIVDAINTKDIPVIQGAILLTSTFYVTVNLLVDISYSVIDPRTRKVSL